MGAVYSLPWPLLVAVTHGLFVLFVMWLSSPNRRHPSNPRSRNARP